MYGSVLLFVIRKRKSELSLQDYSGLTICQGNVKIISLNRGIVIAEFPV